MNKVFFMIKRDIIKEISALLIGQYELEELIRFE
jgi:hypothetical protein